MLARERREVQREQRDVALGEEELDGKDEQARGRGEVGRVACALLERLHLVESLLQLAALCVYVGQSSGDSARRLSAEPLKGE